MNQSLRHATRVFSCLLGLALSVAAASASEQAVPNARQPEPGVTVGGQPTREQLEALQAEGYATVIDLRPVGEFDGFDEAREVELLGMNYVHIPVADVGAITAGNARTLHAALHDASGPVLVHCRSGWRAGSLYAIERYLLHGADEEAALDDAAAAHGDAVTEAVQAWIDDNGR